MTSAQQIAPPATVSSAVHQTAEEFPSSIAVRDLAAQEAMAVWAMWMFVAAAATFVVTFTGTLLILSQVRLTRRAVEDTSKATNAMERQNELAEQTAKRQLRAYVGVADIDASFFPEDLENQYWVPRIRWANTGATPAYNLLRGFHCQTFEGELPPDFDFPFDGSASGSATIAPQQGLWDVGSRIDHSIVLQAVVEKSHTYLWAWAEYSDIYPGSPRRRTECAYELWVENGPSGGLHISFRPLDRHNGMDFNCFHEARPWSKQALAPVEPAS